MPEITFLPDRITVELSEGALILEGARLAGVFVETPCGGKGTCAKCIVRIVSGEVDFLNKTGLDTSDGSVLICQTTILNEPVVVELTNLPDGKGKFADLDISEYLPKVRQPFLKHVALSVPEPQLLDGLSDLDRFTDSFEKSVKCSGIRLPLDILTELPNTLREKEKTLVSYYIANSVAHVVNVSDSNKMYGAAVDIGTTTISLLLVDIESGLVLGSQTAYNAQVECGQDIISRINYAKKYRTGLKDRVLSTINTLISEVSNNAGIQKDNICCLSFAANTTMTQMLLGIEPEYIRLAPYTPAIFNTPVYTAGEIGVDANKNAPVAIAPAVGSYVGGDITAGALCTSLVNDSTETILFIDIGTNGEILLGNNEFIFACACSAGPAFEGGGIKHGVRASSGAIEKVVINSETGVPEIFTIDNADPVGICGSGIISLVAELFRNDLIDSAGKFSSRDCKNIISKGRNREYQLCEGVSISEQDIENLIRAKGAVFSACQTLLDSVGLAFEDLDRVYVAGGFGRFLNLEDSRTIGLLPRLPDNIYEFLGNSSLIGAYLTLVSEEKRLKMHELANATTYVDLSSEPDYMDKYMAAVFLPHTDMSLFE